MILDKLKDNYIFAVIRGKSAEDALEIARHAIKGGIYNMEITYTTPDASEVIKQLKAEFSEDDKVVIGAGTVMTLELAKEAVVAGADFLVSPHYDKEIQRYALSEEVLYFPGCGTVTEIVQAMNGGAKIIKCFPGGVLGPNFIKDVHGPIPNVDLMPSGGVSIDNIATWKQNGACAVGVGSALAADVKEKGYESVVAKAQEFVKACQ